MKQISIINVALKLTLVSVVALQFACSSSTSNVPDDVAISGIITAAPVSASDVSVVDGGGNIVAGPVATNTSGEYSLSIPAGSLAQDLIIKSTGGAFVDEATAKDGTAGEMVAYVAANSLSNGSSVSVTPGSTIMAHLVMNHNKTMIQAQDAFKNAFGYTPDVSVTPADATTAPADDETDDATLAGFRAAAFSQLAMDLGLSQSQDDQFEMFVALAQDLSDDKLDGVDASGAVAIGSTGTSLEVDIQNRFAIAMVNFSNNRYNLTGLDNNEFGDIPFAKMALTTNYQIEYIQSSMMGPVNGKDSFQIHVTNRSDGTDATGLAPMLMPMMYMLGTHKHSTPMPVPAITEDVNGLYTVTLYYLMPTAMGGYWDLKFMVAGEEAHFYPTVMMAMGDTAMVKLKGVDDKIMSMMTKAMVGRTYFMYKDRLTTPDMGSSYDFSIFVASQESMMKFPAIYDGSTLSEHVVDATVQISDDGGVSYVDATDGGNGVWTAAGLTLTDGVANDLRIQLRIDSNGINELKTTDGTVNGNDYQTFTVTPDGM